MPTVHVTLSQQPPGSVEMPRSNVTQVETIQPTATSQASTIQVSASTNQMWTITTLDEPVWVEFGAAPVASSSTGHLILAGRVYEFTALFGDKVAVKLAENVVHKFGRNSVIPSTFKPVCEGGVYRTPQVGSALPLRVRAGHADDTAGGDGARLLSVTVLDTSGAEQVVDLITNGASAGTPTAIDVMRMYRNVVSESGTYADQDNGSHAGDISIEDTGGNLWGTILADDFPRGQSQIGAFTIPLGKRGQISQLRITNDSSKAIDIIIFKRENILQTTAPYSAMRTIQEFSGITAPISDKFPRPIGPYPALTDIWFLAKVASGTAAVTVDFAIILEDD